MDLKQRSTTKIITGIVEGAGDMSMVQQCSCGNDIPRHSVKYCLVKNGRQQNQQNPLRLVKNCFSSSLTIGSSFCLPRRNSTKSLLLTQVQLEIAAQEKCQLVPKRKANQTNFKQQFRVPVSFFSILSENFPEPLKGPVFSPPAPSHELPHSSSSLVAPSRFAAPGRFHR